MTTSFDLTPDPRVLQMLGEINLDQWKCLAELIDNSVDAFISARRQGRAVERPEIAIAVPTSGGEDGLVSVKDNGPGMSIEQLERAVRAGWTGNSPLDSLGLFGMGFNIATARLGVVTEVYTTRAGDSEWTGLRIDLDELRRTRSYHTARLTRPKADHAAHGTEIRVLRLKPDQRAFFAKSVNLNRIRRHLARVYAPLLLSPSTAFALQINGTRVNGKRPCHWSPERAVQGPDGRLVHAVENFDVKLNPRRYCTRCMLDLSTDAEACPTGSPDCKVVTVERRLHGWVGIQRFLHEEDFGIDLVRNGRVIEVANKDLFVYSGGERPDREYPIDDPRNRGRFIGQVHLDHCRVSYTKDRFERDDTSWGEMVHVVRGDGPLQPQKARAGGFPVQDAPLYRLFQAFRRTSPQGKAGRWTRILCLKDNDRALEMAERFDKGDPDYQTDERWYALLEEEDRALVGAAPGQPPAGPVPVPVGLIDDPPQVPQPAPGPAAPVPVTLSPDQQRAARRPILELTRTYRHPTLGTEFSVEAFAATPGDPDLPTGSPWILLMEDQATRTYSFVANVEHQVFKSSTMTPQDALLTELSVKAYEFYRELRPSPTLFAEALSAMRNQYATESRVEPADLLARADAVLRDIAHVCAHGVTPAEHEALFASMPPPHQDQVRRRVAMSGAANLHSVVQSGEFLTYADPAAIRAFVSQHPQLYFDGRFWDQPWKSLDFGDQAVNVAARAAVIDRYDSCLADAVWLLTQSVHDLERADRDALVRASLSLRLLLSDVEQ
jgi:hypothetical protein